MLLSVTETRALEAACAAHPQGHGYDAMIRDAGEAAANAVMARFAGARRALVLIGKGNNGADGLVCAAALLRAGWAVRAWLLQPRDDAWLGAASAAGLALAATPEPRGALVIDAILGTGHARPIDTALARALDAVRGATVIALDGPTGMDHDTGALDAHALHAHTTLALGAFKRGHFCHPAADACGERVLVRTRLTAFAAQHGARPATQLMTRAAARALLPHRAPGAHKGSHGRVLVIGGCDAYPGAPVLAARAAYRAGAGLVSLCVPAAVRASAAALLPEATLVAPGELAAVRDADAVVLGPGLGRSAAARALLREALAWIDAARPPGLVLDADALNLIGDALAQPPAVPTVLTPHPGEMARLCAMDTATVQRDRIGLALARAQSWGRIVVLKGAHTVVASTSGTARVLPHANPALAVAGSGDVLAGGIGGLIAQGLAVFDAATLGAWLHAEAGAHWSARHGDAGLLAGELADLLPAARATLSGRGP